MERYRLELMGITYNQIESGVYAVILREVGGQRRIPIIIGYPEAQAIECKLQEVITPRPLTHDTMINCLDNFGIRLKEIEIRKLPSGVFAADMLFTDGNITRIVDARSSDAIALAIRANAPIYTSAEVLEDAGFDPGSNESKKEVEAETEAVDNLLKTQALQSKTGKKDDYIRQASTETLKIMMQQAAEKEDYEEAARIKEELDKRDKE